MLGKLFKTSALLLSLLPLASFADNIVSDVGNGTANVVEGTGHAVGTVVKDTGQAVGTVVNETGKGVGHIVNGGKSSTNKPSAKAMPDATVTKNVKAKLKAMHDSKQIESSDDLNVTTSKGVVTISGTVAKEDDIPAIKSAINGETGVKSLTVNLKVKP